MCLLSVPIGASIDGWWKAVVQLVDCSLVQYMFPCTAVFALHCTIARIRSSTKLLVNVSAHKFLLYCHVNILASFPGRSRHEDVHVLPSQIPIQL